MLRKSIYGEVVVVQNPTVWMVYLCENV